MPPYELPANMTQSGTKSRSSKGGSAADVNEFRFEDKTGSEQVLLHAQKAYDIEVENDETHWVGHDRTKTIDHDETVHVKHDRTETVDNNETITIQGARTETVDKDERSPSTASAQESVDKDETSASAARAARRSRRIDSRSIERCSIADDREGSSHLEMGGGRRSRRRRIARSTVDGSDSVSIKQDLTMKAGTDDQLSKRTRASSSRWGQNSIKIDQSGITIKGMQVKIEGTVMTEVKGLMTNVKADAMLTVKGAITMIN